MKKVTKILLIGYGSIAKQHHKALNNLKFKKSIFILSNRNFKGKNFVNRDEVKNLDPDYVIICSETIHHIKDLKFIEKTLKNKIILIEKPVFEKIYELKKLKNKYFVNYQLRLHPIIQKIKKLFTNKKILNLQVNCNSFLPNWRNRDYTKIYSSKKNKGGGVLLDLSHELDYILWIFKKIKFQHVKMRKISSLKIDSDDHLSLSGTVSGKGSLQLNLSYFSKLLRRTIYIDSNEVSFYGDLIKNSFKIKRLKKEIVKSYKINQIKLLSNVHRKIISKKFNNLCSLKEGILVLKFIERIKKA